MMTTEKSQPDFKFVCDDEWEQVRYSIENELEFLSTESIQNLPDHNRENLFINCLIHFFQRDLMNKLVKKGFTKDIVEDPEEISWIVKQGSYFKCPEDILKYSSDKRHISLDDETKSALRSLLSLYTFKNDIETIIFTDNERYKVFLRTFLLLIDVFRTGRLKHIKHGFPAAEEKNKDRQKTRSSGKKRQICTMETNSVETTEI